MIYYRSIYNLHNTQIYPDTSVCMYVLSVSIHEGQQGAPQLLFGGLFLTPIALSVSKGNRAMFGKSLLKQQGSFHQVCEM